MNIENTILELSSMSGPAGFELTVAERIHELLSTYMDETYLDVMGNVIGVRHCGKENALKLLFDAHIDEIGFIITGMEDGYLKFSTLGGVDLRMLPAAEIKILTDPPIYGIVGVTPPHILKAEESDKAIKLEDLYIDVGMTQETAEKAVMLGTPAVYNNRSKKLGNHAICGKALDDRASLSAILRALELLKNETLDVDLYVMASVQEEVGTRGAKTGAYSISPDYCIVIDVEHAKTPDCKTTQTKEFGGGVVISKGPNMNRRFTEKAIELAKEKGIKHQIGVEAGGNSGTNAQVIQTTRNGIATALFGLPLKYMHSPVEVINLADFEATAQLLCEIAKGMKGEQIHA